MGLFLKSKKKKKKESGLWEETEQSLKQADQAWTTPRTGYPSVWPDRIYSVTWSAVIYYFYWS